MAARRRRKLKDDRVSAIARDHVYSFIVEQVFKGSREY
jgi:hypothetical protein